MATLHSVPEIIQHLKRTPYYASEFGRVNLMARGELFSIGDSAQRVAEYRVPHWHDAYELGFVRSGQGLIAMGDEEYFFRADQVYIVNNLEPHMAYALNEDCQFFVVHFHPTLIDDGWTALLGGKAKYPFLPDFALQDGPLIPVDDPVTPPVLALLKKIRCEVQQKNHSWEIVVGGLLFQAIGLLTRRLLELHEPPEREQQQRAALHKIEPILHLIEEQFHTPLTLNEMADAAHLSSSHCCALFRTALNTTPVAYRNMRRLSRSLLLLQQTDSTISEIAHQVGFQSIQEFNRTFRRTYEMTPSDFRAKFLHTAVQHA